MDFNRPEKSRRYFYARKEVKTMKSIIEYIKDIKWWAGHYPKYWFSDKKHRKTRIYNALYCTAPANWKLYNRFVRKMFGA